VSLSDDGDLGKSGELFAEIMTEMFLVIDYDSPKRGGEATE
jgi:hypothetical protein